ncbi:MAG TPA: NAD(P)H-hydrate dehydratase, partial [Pseudomonadales bacterium]|nr:NAD(P)H-hydrate dehydratase [Pseudomonadales bacterium]
RSAHKGMFGHLLIIGGNHGYGGAVSIAAEAALRAGAGLVTIATRGAHLSALLARRPEAMVRAVESGQDLEPLLALPTVILLGPGLGQDAWAEQMVQRVLGSDLPLVVDADGLNLLARRATPVHRENWILTPHPGEAARLLGCDSREVEADRFAAVQQLAERHGGVALLKGAGTLVASAAVGGGIALCAAGNPGMASGGMGDLLSGLIAALLAQQLSLVDAARAGVLLHAMAGDEAAGGNERGLLATDLLAPLRRWVNPL